MNDRFYEKLLEKNNFLSNFFFLKKNKMKGESTIPSHYVVLENVFGLIGTAFWSFQLVPQGKMNNNQFLLIDTLVQILNLLFGFI